MTKTAPRFTEILAAAVAAVLLSLATPSSAHSGGLAQDGCHWDRQAGTRHCHRGEAAAPEAERYRRKDWQHWIDADGDGLNTRHEVLAQESLETVTISAGKVTRGKWLCPFTGKVFTDPRPLDIDHMVPLKEAHDSGGSSWSESKKTDYANDLTEPAALVAVDRRANRRKGAKDPAGWMPAVKPCAYLRNWLQVKRQWHLTMDLAEKQAIQQLLHSNKCTDVQLTATAE